MKRLFLEGKEIPRIEGIVEDCEQVRDTTNFYVNLGEDNMTPEGVCRPFRSTENQVPIRNGDRVVVYNGWTEEERLGYSYGLQILDRQGNELFAYRRRCLFPTSEGNKALEWRCVPED